METSSFFRKNKLGEIYKEVDRMKKILSVFILPLVLMAGTKLLRMPHISGDRIIFSYQGDIWMAPATGGRACRVTSSPGFESYPRFSPDGKFVAFTGQYHGGMDVYVVPVGGGDPVKLTYHSGREMVVGWTPGGKVVFISDREAIFPTATAFYMVSPRGGFPEKLPIDKGSFIDFSPDGRFAVFNRNSGYFWWWKRYKGSANLDVWLVDLKTKKFRKLTSWEGNDAWPMWGADGRVYFVSERDGIANLYSLDPGAKDPSATLKKHTHFKEDGIQWPSISTERDRIAFEQDGEVFVYYIKTGKLVKLDIDVQGDLPFPLRQVTNPRDLLGSFSVSPGGKRLAVEARGEIFSVPKKHGPTRNLSHSPRREKSPAWSPDGKYVAFVSDRDGEDQIYLVEEKSGKTEKITGMPLFKKHLVWSPDGKKIAFSTNDGGIHIVFVKDKKTVLVDKNPTGETLDYSWSPDSNYLAYTKRERNQLGDIFVYSLKEKKAYRLVSSSFDDFSPAFTPDGKRLIYLSVDVIRPAFDFFSEMITVKGGTKVMSVDLVPGLPNIYEPPSDEVEVKEEKGKAQDSGQKKKDEGLLVKIDFKGIERRIRPVPVSPGHYYTLEAVGDYYVFWDYKGRVLKGYNTKSRKTETLIKGVEGYDISPDGKFVAYRKGKKVAIARLGKVSKDEFVSFRDLRMELDRLAEWQQIFDEAWRMVKDYFYDKNLHGVDWVKIRKHYEALLPYVRTRQELNLLLEEMVGELNASHQGARGGDYGVKLPRYSVGYLGVKFTPDRSRGLYRISHIYAHDPDVEVFHNPAFGRLKEGEYILKIGDQVVSTSRNIYSYLVGYAGKQVELLVSPDGSEARARKVTIKAIPSETMLIYHDWVEKNRRYVEEKSGGKIGYIHLHDMVGFGMSQFLRWINAYRYKDAVIIDVRFNGGGGIDPYLIDILERRPYQTVKGRNEIAVERPMGGFYGHVAVLINQFSYSDAEVFPAAVKARKLGTLIGVPTLGFVIAVTAYPMIDGGYVRRTSWGLWELSGEMLEGRGAIPDIYVENPPEAVLAGKDPQLDKAIEYLLEQIKKNPRKKYPRDFFKKH